MPSDHPPTGSSAGPAASPAAGRPALALVAAAMLAGCAGYTDVDACADLATMVWPWQRIDGMTAEVTLAAAAPETPVYPTRAIIVSGMQGNPMTGEPGLVAFQCVHRGELLQSFGWVAPAMAATPAPVAVP